MCHFGRHSKNEINFGNFSNLNLLSLKIFKEFGEQKFNPCKSSQKKSFLKFDSKISPARKSILSKDGRTLVKLRSQHIVADNLFIRREQKENDSQMKFVFECIFALT